MSMANCSSYELGNNLRSLIIVLILLNSSAMVVSAEDSDGDGVDESNDLTFYLPSEQSDILYIASGFQSYVEFMIQHNGTAGSPIKVEMMLVTTLPNSWDAHWDKPAGYELSGGGAFARPILQIEAPDGDLGFSFDTPVIFEIRARATVNDGGDNQGEEVALEVIFLTVENLSEPRISIFEDLEHQRQIADSNRPETYDAQLSHSIDPESGGIFFIDIFDFTSRRSEIRVENVPDGWQYRLYDNGTGVELANEGAKWIATGHGQVVMEIYPPSNRDASHFGLVELRVTTGMDRSSVTSFTVQTNFGILAEVIADSDAGDLGVIGPVDPGSSVSYQIRITDQTTSGSQNTWKIISPDKLTANTDADSSYAAWTYALTDDNDTLVVAINLSANETFDLELAITMTEQVLVGDYTIYLRVLEERVDSNTPRYFDLPVIIKVGEMVTPGSILVEKKTATSSFLPLQSKNIEFIVKNMNNVLLPILITVSNTSNRWDFDLWINNEKIEGAVGESFVLLWVPAFSQEEFTMVVTPPDNISSDVYIEFLVQISFSDEISYPTEYNQYEQFSFTSTCEGSNCAVNPSSQTIGTYVVLAWIIPLAICIIALVGVVLYHKNKSKIQV
jgi:hypothetical protein